MEEEKLRLESEKSVLQKDKVSLETKLKQAIEHSEYIVSSLVHNVFVLSSCLLTLSFALYLRLLWCMI